MCLGLYTVPGRTLYKFSLEVSSQESLKIHLSPYVNGVFAD